MRRILIFSLAYMPYIGGAELAIKEITDRIDPAEIEFHIITLRFDSAWAKEEKVGNVWVHRIGFGRRGASVGGTFSPLFYVSKICFIPLAAMKAIRLNRTEHFDSAWAMMTYMVFPIMLMRLSIRKLPYVLTIQEGDTFERQFGRARMKPFLPLLTYGIRHATVVQAISHFLGTWALRMGFRGILEIIPNGVDGHLYAREMPLRDKLAMRQKFGISERDCVLITVSRLVPKNGVDLVVRALASLPDRVKFFIVGDGPDRVELERLAKELQVASRVIFAEGAPHAEVPSMLQFADIFIRASRSEGQGVAFIEAMAAGLPVVAPQIGGITDFLFDAERDPAQEPTGFAIDPESPVSIAQVVQKIIDDPLRAHQIAVDASRMVSRDYDWNKIAEDINERVFKKTFV